MNVGFICSELKPKPAMKSNGNLAAWLFDCDFKDNRSIPWCWALLWVMGEHQPAPKCTFDQATKWRAFLKALAPWAPWFIWIHRISFVIRVYLSGDWSKQAWSCQTHWPPNRLNQAQTSPSSIPTLLNQSSLVKTAMKSPELSNMHICHFPLTSAPKPPRFVLAYHHVSPMFIYRIA